MFASQAHRRTCGRGTTSAVSSRRLVGRVLIAGHGNRAKVKGMSHQRIAIASIRGRVQGVCFRAWTQHQAELRGLEGWVRNRRDGSVEAVFAGPPETVDAMLKACRQGPRGSQVEDVDVQETGEGALKERPEASGFVLLGTA